MLKQRVALLVSYDGTDYCGWQVQRGSLDPSIQGELERAAKEIWREPVLFTGSGRTDSGVHATGQVAHADLPMNIPAHRVREALNSQLPGMIRILSSRAVPGDFHARYSALRREYSYHIHTGSPPPAHMRNYCYYMRQPYSLSKLNSLVQPLLGVHDFTTFSAAGDQSHSKIREIFHADFHREGPFLVFRIGGNAFLWRMVRSLTGTLLQAAKEGKGPEDIRQKLESRCRLEAGPTAPARGLFLERIDYGSEYSFF